MKDKGLSIEKSRLEGIEEVGFVVDVDVAGLELSLTSVKIRKQP